MPTPELGDPALVQPWWQLDQQVWLLLCAVLAFGVAVGWTIASLRKEREAAALRLALDTERRQNLERHQALQQTFAALSAEALQRNNRSFLQLAQQVLARFNSEAKGDLELRQQAVRELVAPLHESLRRTEQQLQALERDRRESHGALTRQLEGLVKTQQALQAETRNLVQALRRPEVRGQWGELTLRRLAELSGMVDHCDFSEQLHTAGDAGHTRPDMVVHMPGGRQVVVDVKTPLDAYLSAIEAGNDSERDRLLARHARHVRERVRELAAKRYWDQFTHAPEFVVLFIPGDQFLSVALDQDPALLEEALSRKVILATPTSFVALLRAVAYGWRQESLNRNAEKIRLLGEDLYRRIVTLAEHLGKLGRHLDAGVKQYNRVLGSYESKVVPGARKFVELGIAEERDFPASSQVESGVRESSRPDTE